VDLAGGPEAIARAFAAQGLRMGNGEDDEDDERLHAFWDTQPVPKLSDTEVRLLEKGEAIEPDKKPEEIRQEPYELLGQFEWSDCAILDDDVSHEVYKLLNENYVEDSDAMFRFDYGRDFLRWALTPPGWRPSWHVGVRVRASQKLVAFIAATPATIAIREHAQPMAEINFLCVHKKLRSKRLAPVLIKEITRRVHLAGTFQAVYTAGVKLPRPVTSCRYFHRSLNPKKLIDIGFSRLQPRMTLSRTIRLFSLPEKPATPGIRPMGAADVAAGTRLFNSSLAGHQLKCTMDEAEFAHWFLPREGVVSCFVVEDPEKSGEVTDLVSYYSLPSSVMKHEFHKTLNAAYSFYQLAGKTPLRQLMKDALILAKGEGFDVFNALTLMDNEEVFDELKFHPGDGILNFYLYNWRVRPLEPHENALVLL